MGSWRLTLDLWTRADLRPKEFAISFVSSFAEELPTHFPDEWDDINDDPAIVSARDFGAAVDMWLSNSIRCGRSIMASRHKRSSLIICFLCGQSRQPHSIFLDLEGVAGGDAVVAASARLFHRWVTISNADFGRLCCENEWKHKNVIEQFVEDDGGVIPWKVFHQKITTGLPGVYWSTYFGPAIAEWLGVDRVATLPWPRVERHAGGFFAVRSSSPMDWQADTELDRRALKHLGEDRVFDMAQRQRPLQTPPLPIPDYYPEATRAPRRVRTKAKVVDLSERLRSAAEADKHPQAQARLVHTVKFFRSMGFFSSCVAMTDVELATRLDFMQAKKWRSGFDPNRPTFELEVLKWDAQRVWWDDTEVDAGEGNDVYVELLQDWGKISRGAFEPRDVAECWDAPEGPIYVSFMLGGRACDIAPRYLEDYFDVGVIGQINRLIDGEGMAFQVYEAFDQTAFVIVLDESEKGVLEKERGWKFMDL
jgi:hypothetical protein